MANNSSQEIENVIHSAAGLSETEKQLLLDIVATWPQEEVPVLLAALKGEAPVASPSPSAPPKTPAGQGANLAELKKRLEEKKVDFRPAPPELEKPKVQPALPPKPSSQPSPLENKTTVVTPEVKNTPPTPPPAPKFIHKKSNKTLEDIKSTEDLEQTSLGDLRNGDFKNNLDELFKKIFEIARKEKILPYVIISAFEKSPANTVFVGTAFALMNETGGDRQQIFNKIAEEMEKKYGDSLTNEEFNSFTEFKSQLGRLM